MAFTDLQKKNRKTYIGGSEIAAILGLTRNKTAFDVWASKTGKAIEKEHDESIDDLPALLGTLLEPVVRQLYEKKHPEHRVELMDFVRHPEYSLVGATPDSRIVVRDSGEPVALHEIKTKQWHTAREFGEPGTDQLPEKELCQAQWELFAAVEMRLVLSVLVDARSYAEYVINADPELHTAMYQAAHDFWHKHVIPDVPPPPRGITGQKWIHAMLKQQSEEMLRATPEVENLLGQLAGVREQISLFEDQELDLQNQIKLFIGEHGGVHGQWGKVTWRTSKPTTVFNAKEAFATIESMIGVWIGRAMTIGATAGKKVRPHEAAALVAGDVKRELIELQKAQTFERPGSRRFLFTPAKEVTKHD